ncbi:conserved hypothetical protein [Methanococcus vannielii SB]|uniref:Bacterial Ig-like domain-containing protein n=1 Tax=Methanococcus vannielii (strain ATCC 35089 / DSM 1224 / JCM 13029 / OCM 148 / SB) TaxID=406327 RepID=A6UNM5_METVS|nr:hypothetical protein [Methanococcus vannielii]ABR54097.1 conserved hypothetical protein [Methanococcus vannielii SB]
MLKKTIIGMLSILIAISSIFAISDITITPENPKVGDTVILSGKTNPNEEITCSAWFELAPALSDPYYGAMLYNVEIPETPNSFKVTAENVESLSLSVKMGLWVTINGNVDSSGKASVSQSNVPKGTYDIKIAGKIKDSSKPVKIKMSASTKIKADSNGYFEYRYNTKPIEEGTVIHLNIGGVSKNVLVSGNTPSPIVTPISPVIVDKTAPKISIIEPSKSNYSENSIEYDIIATDDSSFTFKIYLNSRELTYNKEGNNFKGTLNLIDGKNELKIVAEDIHGNKNIITKYITYSKESINNDPIKDDDLKNKVIGTILLNVGNALLTVNDGTVISTNGEIKIQEVKIPETALAYIIYPENAEFSSPLNLEVDVSLLSSNLRVIYYDSNKGWVNVPYNKNGNIISLEVTKSGHYAIKELEIVEEKKDSLFDKIKGILNAVKIGITVLFSKIFK